MRRYRDEIVNRFENHTMVRDYFLARSAGVVMRSQEDEVRYPTGGQYSGSLAIVRRWKFGPVGGEHNSKPSPARKGELPVHSVVAELPEDVTDSKRPVLRSLGGSSRSVSCLAKSAACVSDSIRELYDPDEEEGGQQDSDHRGRRRPR